MHMEMFSKENDFNLSEFDCGDSGLNTFLKEQLARQHEQQVLRAYLLISDEEDRRVVGFYTLAGSAFEKALLPSKNQQRRIPYRNVPSVTLGRLAIDRRIQRRGWGEVLVAHAMEVVYRASLAVGIHGMFVEALDDNARRFYQQLGFIQLKGQNGHALFCPIKSFVTLSEVNDPS